MLLDSVTITLFCSELRIDVFVSPIGRFAPLQLSLLCPRLILTSMILSATGRIYDIIITKNITKLLCQDLIILEFTVTHKLTAFNPYMNQTPSHMILVELIQTCTLYNYIVVTVNTCKQYSELMQQNIILDKTLNKSPRCKQHYGGTKSTKNQCRLGHIEPIFQRAGICFIELGLRTVIGCLQFSLILVATSGHWAVVGSLQSLILVCQPPIYIQHGASPTGHAHYRARN